MDHDHRRSIFSVILIAALLGSGFILWDRFENREVPRRNPYRLESPVPAAEHEAAGAHTGLLSGLAGSGGGIKANAAAPDKLQTKAEFVEAFKTLLLSNITIDDAKRCKKVVKEPGVCNAWDEADAQLQYEPALYRKDIVGLVSPHYISCLRAKKQEMIDGFTDGSSSYNIQERNILVAKAACLSKAASTVLSEARAAADASSRAAIAAAPANQPQTRDEFVNAFKTLLLSNITIKDAGRCYQVVGDQGVCGVWDQTDTQLLSDRALSGKDIVGLVSPHYISCLRAKKQEMIDGFVEGASTFNKQEQAILTAKAACLSKAASIVIAEAHAK